MKTVSVVKAATESSFENFQRELPFREICVAKTLKKTVHSLWPYYIAFSSTSLLLNQKLVINIRFTCKHSINQ